MFGIGLPELIVIAVVALLVVGPKKLPDLAKSLGKGLQEFKKASEGVTESIKDTLKPDDLKEDMEDFKDSLLYGKKGEGEEPTDSPPKDASSQKSP
jgi:Tat protein translocase TatB subunit